MPLIPRLFHENRALIDLEEKAEIFKSFFSKKCSLITNHSKIPLSPSYLTHQRLPTVTFPAEGKFIRRENYSKSGS